MCDVHDVTTFGVLHTNQHPMLALSDQCTCHGLRNRLGKIRERVDGKVSGIMNRRGDTVKKNKKQAKCDMLHRYNTRGNYTVEKDGDGNCREVRKKDKK